MHTENDILTQAQNIKQYCAEHITNEEQCPFFHGYTKYDNVSIVICELNKGHCSPCNWNV